MHTQSLYSTPTRRSKGFSLVEMLIAIALLAVVMGFLIQNFGGILGSNERKLTKMFVENGVEAPLMAYRNSVGSYPTSEQGLMALYQKPANVPASRWVKALSKEPRDPWGNLFQYRYPGQHNSDGYDIWSWGPDGQEGGGDDIGNWEDGN